MLPSEALLKNEALGHSPPFSTGFLQMIPQQSRRRSAPNIVTTESPNLPSKVSTSTPNMYDDDIFKHFLNGGPNGSSGMILVDERSLQSILVLLKQEACLVCLSSKGSRFVQILIAIEANTNRELGCLNAES